MTYCKYCLGCSRQELRYEIKDCKYSDEIAKELKKPIHKQVHMEVNTYGQRIDSGTVQRKV